MTTPIIKEEVVFSEPQFKRFMRSLDLFYVDLVNDPSITDYDRCIVAFIRGYLAQSGKEFTEEQLTKVEDYVLELENQE